ncbi:hypothetical protein Poli38472_010502 [Pythium oligandrum]|uniref:FHA domain-containing protein n=1 Tax=Pythium oligandrum TaxID=41045 RepID=A0A8K1F9V3_PYTOL|nr:hypothetical protein Poli38472_010502 [Pythium oligandrum]|eukprot:TMW55620.1 hypothetical protein Poli38472_010502 [Pythium oligandrum]
MAGAAPTTAPYAPPEWGVDGSNAFNIYMDVIKGGLVVESLTLPPDASKSFVVAGRMEPVCDLVLQHPSISRVHAVLQFDIHGALFVKDMNSTYGTFVNKKRLVPNQFERLHIGDIVVFGESTRMYALCGPAELLPEEYDSANLQAFRARLEKKQNEARSMGRREKPEEESGASWGFGEDAEEEDDEDSDEEDKKASHKGRGGESDLPSYLRGLKERDRAYESSVKASDVSEKDQKLFQQLQTKIKKMENLETEKSRILAKQNDLQGLSEGQEMTLERNNARIEALQKEIESLEDQLHARNAQREKSRSAVATKKKTTRKEDARYDYDSDEDDFYDRTKANQRKQQERLQVPGHQSGVAPVKASAPQTLTAESIQKTISELKKELAAVVQECARAASSEQGESKTEDEVDALDAFMQATTQQLQQSERVSLETKRKELEAQLKQQEQLLAIAMPALAAVPTPTPTVMEKVASPPRQEATTPVQKESMEPLDAEKTRERAPPVPERTQEKVVKKDLAPVTAPADEPQPKKRRVMGPTLPPPPSSGSYRSTDGELEGGERVWVPPSNQTGDGRTALNDKYGY